MGDEEYGMRKLVMLLVTFVILVTATYGQLKDDRWNELSTSIFPIELSYERYLSEYDSIGLEFDYPLLLDNWYFGSAVTRFLFEYKRYLDGKGSGFYLTVNSGVGSELKYSSPGQNWRSLSFIPWALTGVYVGGNALSTNRYQVDYIPVNVGLGWKILLGNAPVDLRLTIGYANITGYRNDVGQKVGSLAELPYQTEAYLANQALNFAVSPHFRFSF